MSKRILILVTYRQLLILHFFPPVIQAN